MNNECIFSPCRAYRYSLVHEIAPALPRRRAMWIGLNPSTADESQLDPTLRRIRDFTTTWGYNGFVMTNLFAFRATDPKVMKAQPDPVGIENDRVLIETAKSCDLIVAAWGAHGSHMDRASAVLKLLQGLNVHCLGITQEGHPRHPLYLKRATPLQLFQLSTPAN
ncbi:MAG: DUF1643 domain-containing protein [Opitutus sp.]|nr:DUF1643 domain-containing protein [Opitutus sp.]